MPSITIPSTTRIYNPRMPFLLTPLDNKSKDFKNMNTNNTYYS